MKTIKAMIIAGLLTSTAVMAGKNVVPAASPVVPVLNPIPLYVGLGLLWAGTSLRLPCADDKRL